MDLDECPDLLRVAEAADVLRVSKSRVYEEIAVFTETNGRLGLPAIRIGRVLRVPRETLKRWIDDQLTPSRHVDDARAPDDIEGLSDSDAWLSSDRISASRGR